MTVLQTFGNQILRGCVIKILLPLNSLSSSLMKTVTVHHVLQGSKHGLHVWFKGILYRGRSLGRRMCQEENEYIDIPFLLD